MSPTSLEVSGLVVTVRTPAGEFHAVDRVSFEVAPGAAFGLVGESGSGKSLTLRAIMGLLPPVARVSAGRVSLSGAQLAFDGKYARRMRRGRMAMIFQDPLSALNPVQTAGHQVAEVCRRIMKMSSSAAKARAVELLGLAGIPDPERRASAYPHQLSGGIRQRVMISIALASEPSVLLCDEPTTALDVTVQAQVLELIDDLRRRLGLTVVFVSHDLAVVRQLCEEVAVMYPGRLVEKGPTAAVLDFPLHPYTKGLLEAAVDLDEPVGAPRPIPGSIPDAMHLPSGCSFRTRCTYALAECQGADMALVAVGSPEAGRSTACINYRALLPA